MLPTDYRKPKGPNTEPWGIPHVASETDKYQLNKSVALFLWLFYFDSLILFLYFCMPPSADVSRGSMTSLLVQPISAFLAKTLLSSPAAGRGDSCVPIAMPRNAGEYISVPVAAVSISVNNKTICIRMICDRIITSLTGYQRFLTLCDLRRGAWLQTVEVLHVQALLSGQVHGRDRKHQTLFPKPFKLHILLMQKKDHITNYNGRWHVYVFQKKFSQ